MQHFYSLDDIHLNDVWLSIGSFDGVHLGHQAIIHKLTAGALQDGVPAVVLTFHPHPSIIVRRRSGAYYLTSPDERAEILGTLGVDYVITHPFNQQVARMSAHEFMENIHKKLKPKHLIVGHDFALGRDRGGNVDELARIGTELHYTLTDLPPVRNHDVIISSSRIRTALGDGDVALAGKFLGRPYRLSGEVVPGDGRGKSLGIPTANIDVWAEKALPASGVYACRAVLDDKPLEAVVNVGFRPTFESQTKEPTIEAHMLEFNQDIYGKFLALDFIERIRAEVKFASIDALVAQINQDINKATSIL